MKSYLLLSDCGKTTSKSFLRFAVQFFHNFQGSTLTTFSLLGIFFSSTVIYCLLRLRIKLSKCQNLFIINIAVSDVMVSLAGVFRGLGILDSKYIGAENGISSLPCALFTISLNTLASSGILTWLPLTLDRAVAIIFPLKHMAFLGKNTSVLMIVVTWLPVCADLIYYSVVYAEGIIAIEYDNSYHRCVISKQSTLFNLIEQLILVVIPFALVIILQAAIMATIVKGKRTFGRFLGTSCGIILSNIIIFAPSVVTYVCDIQLSYKVSMILTVTLYYTNGIINPLIYVATHPVARRYFTKRLGRGGRRNPAVQPSKSSLLTDMAVIENATSSSGKIRHTASKSR